MRKWKRMRFKRFDIRKVRKLAARERYAEIYFYWREAEHMSASALPQARRSGRRLKKRLEQLYAKWFGGMRANNYIPQAASEI